MRLHQSKSDLQLPQDGTSVIVGRDSVPEVRVALTGPPSTEAAETEAAEAEETEAEETETEETESEEAFQSRAQTGSEYRAMLWDLQKSNSEQCDNTILTLSSALLGVSLAFIKDIVPIAHLTAIGWLTFSWFMFGAAITCTLASYYSGQEAIDTECEYSEEVHMKGNTGYVRNRLWDKATRLLNATAALCFLFGVFTTICVVTTNIYHEQARQSQGGANQNGNRTNQGNSTSGTNPGGRQSSAETVSGSRRP